MEKENPFKSNSSFTSSSNSVQRKASNGKPDDVNVKSSLVQMSIADQAKKNSNSRCTDSKSRMPEDIQTKMEKAFNTDFSDVNIHQGDSATSMNAHAYTQGNNIHFAPGQYNPQSKLGQELLGHELTHVVQQRKGNVQPTTQLKGVGINDDKGLEQEADVMGKRAAEGKEASIQMKAEGSVQRMEVKNSNSVLFDLETTGAGKDTASHDRLGYTGVKASETLAEKDFDRITALASLFIEVGGKYGIPPALLSAIASRESRAGLGLAADGYGKYDSNGYGIMQIDKGQGKNESLAGPKSKEHIDMAANHFVEGWKGVKKAHPDWDAAWQLRGAVAAYNFGYDDVQTKSGIDKGSTGNDYSADIWARARYYAGKKEFGGTTPMIANGNEVKNDNSPETKISLVNSVTEESSKNKNIDYSDYDIKGENLYIVQEGDKLSTISSLFSIDIAILTEVNSDVLKTWGTTKGFNFGEVIVIPNTNVSEILSKRSKPVVKESVNTCSNTTSKPKPTANPSGSSKSNKKPTVNPLYEGKFLDDIATKVYEGVSTIWGTDEEAVYSALAKLNHDSKAIELLKQTYSKKYGASLIEDLEGDFSFGEWDKVKGYLNVSNPKSNKQEPKNNTVEPTNKLDATSKVSSKAFVPYDKIPDSFKSKYIISDGVGLGMSNKNEDVAIIHNLLLLNGYKFKLPGKDDPSNKKIQQITWNAIFQFQLMNALTGDCKIGAKGETLKKLVEKAYLNKDCSIKGKLEDDQLFEPHKLRLGDKKNVPSELIANITGGYLIGIDNSGHLLPEEFHSNGKKLKNALEVIKEEIGNFEISCSYRSPEHNTLVAESTASMSQHLYGIAADIQKTSDYSPRSLRKTIIKLIEDGKIPQGGVGLYDWGVHYDIRGTASRWDG